MQLNARRHTSTVVAAALLWLGVLPAPAFPHSQGPPKKGEAERSAGQPPPAAATEARSFDLRIERRKVAGGTRTVTVRRGEQVSLRWTTDEAVTVHLHGYDIEQTVKPGESNVVSFKAYATGRFPIEAHEFGGKKTKHITLLYLEVLPR